MDLVRIKDGKVILTEELKHTTGNIVSLIKLQDRLHEVAMATEMGVFFANIRRGGYGLMQADIEKFD
jgi:hypothetical protein